jgi:hypothetical protein
MEKDLGADRYVDGRKGKGTSQLRPIRRSGRRLYGPEDWGTSDRTGAYRFCRNRIAIYKEPHFVEFVDSLPRNLAGKILKRELRARAQKTTEPSGYGVRL